MASKRFLTDCFLPDLVEDFFTPHITTRSYSLRTYDPDKYELKPRKDYLTNLLKEKDEAIAYHEEKIKVLREEKERLQKQE